MSENSPTTTTKPEILRVEEFQNEHLLAKVEQLPHCIANFHVTVYPAGSEAAYTKAVKAVAKEVSLPGFRKGKAPQSHILKNFSSHIDNEWRNTILRSAVQEALDLSKLQPLSKESVRKPKLIKAAKEENSEVSFEIEYYPHVPQIDINDISIREVQPKPVTEQDFSDEINQIRLYSAVWNQVADREAQPEDFVDLDIVSLDQPGEILCSNTRFEMNDSKMSPWLYNKVLGMKPGEKKEGVSERSTNDLTALDQEADAEFIPTRCEITLRGIYKAELPELNDEFAKKVGAENLSMMEERVRKSLNLKAFTTAWNAMEAQVIKQLLEKYLFELPVSLYSAEQQMRLKSIKQRLDSKGIPREEAAQIMAETQKYLKSLPERYRLFLLARDFAAKHKIEITGEELSDELQHQLLMGRTNLNSLIDETMSPEFMQYITYNSLLLNKTVAFIVKNAKHVE